MTARIVSWKDCGADEKQCGVDATSKLPIEKQCGVDATSKLPMLALFWVCQL
jgi:hypothetical protein